MKNLFNHLDKLELLKVSLSALLAFILTFSPVLPSFKLEHFKLLGALTSEASYITWTGAGSDNRWSNQDNWNEHVVPGADDIATFNGTSSKDVIIENDISVAGIDITYEYKGKVKLTSTQRITVGTSGIVQKGGTFDGGSTPIIIYGSLKIIAGHFIAPRQDLDIKQHLTILTDKFDHNTGNILFTGSDQIIFGSAALNNFVKKTNKYDRLELQSGSLLIFKGNLTLSGTNTAPLDLRSSVDGQPASINPLGPNEISHLDVKDIINIGSTISCPETCIDSGNNTGWNLPAVNQIGNTPLVIQTPKILSQIDKLLKPANSDRADEEPAGTSPTTLNSPPAPPSPANPGSINLSTSDQPQTITDKPTADFSFDEKAAFTVNIKPSTKEIILDPVITQDSNTIKSPAVNTSSEPSPAATPDPSPPSAPGNETPLSVLFKSKIIPAMNQGIAAATHFFVLPVARAAVNVNDPSSNNDLQPAEPGRVHARIFDPSGQELDILPTITDIDGSTVVTLPEPGNSIRPGKYRLEVTVNIAGQDVTVTQDFTWGVLAMNFNQSTYNISDEVTIGIGVLDDGGRTLCDANLTLDITGQDDNGLGIGHWALGIGDGISRSPNCGPATVTNTPDYSANFTPDKVGEYNLHLQAATDNGIRTMDRSFVVTNDAPFVTKRSSATRIFPLADYTSSVTITANEDFQGDVYEPIPDNFKIKGITAPGTVIFTSAGEKPYTPAGVGGPSSVETPGYPPDKGGEGGLENNPTPGVSVAPIITPGVSAGPDSPGVDVGNMEVGNAVVNTPAISADPAVVTPGVAAPQSLGDVGAAPLAGSSVIANTPAVSAEPVVVTPGVAAGSASPGVDVGSVAASPTPAIAGDTSSSQPTPSPSPSPLASAIPSPTPTSMLDSAELLKLLEDIQATLSRDHSSAGSASTIEPLNPAIYNQQLADQDQYIVWRDVTIKAGESVTLTYIYDAPDKSPEFYLLGPLSLFENSDIENSSWHEPRSWQIAADAVFTATASDDWNMGTAWGGACTTGCVAGTDFPGTSDTAVITDYSITVLSTVAASVTNLNINSGGKLITDGNNLTVSGDFVIDQGGTLIGQGGETISAIDTNNGTVMYNGTAQYNGLAAGDSYNDLIINNGLVGYWKFDDGTGTTVWSDFSGYGNDGTGIGATGDNNTPQANAANAASLNFSNPFALDFDGTDDYVNAGSDSSLDDIQTKTISAWVKRNSVVDSDHNIISKGSASPTTYGWNLIIRRTSGSNPNALRYYHNWSSSAGGTAIWVGSTELTSTSGWYHVAMIYNSGSTANNPTMYVNGVAETVTETAAPSGTEGIDAAYNLHLGASVVPGAYGDFLMDDVRIYDHALTEQEINTLAAGSISPTGTGLQLLDANLDVNGDLTINDGELDVSSSNYTINVAGSYENNGGAFNPRSSTVTLDGTSGSHELQIGGQAFNNLTVSGSGGTWTLNDDLDVDGTYTQSNGTLNTNSTDNWSVHANDFDQTAGTFTPNTSSVTVDSASNQTIQAASSLYDLQVEDPTETGLVGYWKFDEGQGTTAADSSGNANHGTLTNAPKWSTTVTSTISYDNPYSLDFDGSDDYIPLGTPSSLNTSYTTLSLWAKADNLDPAVDAHLFNRQNASPGTIFLVIDAPSNVISFRIRTTDNTARTVTSNNAISSGWHHYAGTYDGEIVKLYIDGVLQANTLSITGSMYTASYTAVDIGRHQTTANTYYDGLLDDVRVYNRALFAGEIVNLAEGNYADGASSDSVYTLGANLDVNGSTYLQSGELDVSSSNYAITNAGSWYGNGGGFNPRSGTVTLDGTSGTNTLRTGAQPFNNLTVSGSGGTWNLTDTLDVNGTYTQSNGTVDVANFSLHAQDFDKTAGTLTTRDQTVVIDGTSNQTIQSDSALTNLQIEDPTESNLVGYWKFDEGQGTVARDSSGNANVGTLAGGPTWSTTVTSTITYDNPYSLDFDGTNDYITVAHNANLEITGDLTIGAWVYHDDSVSADAIISKGGCWNTICPFDIVISAADLVMFHQNDGSAGQDTLTSGGTVGLAAWHHVVATRDSVGATRSIYIDGSLDTGPTGYTKPATASGDAVNIGNTGDAPFDGLLDDVRVYNAALSAPEIQNLADGYYANGDSGTATFTLNANLDVNNSLTLQSGVLDVSATPYNITLAKDWNNYGGASSFTDQTGNVTLDGSSQTIRGTTTFYTLTDQETSADTLTFETGKTQTIANSLNFDGAISNLLSLRSSVPSTRYTLDVTSAQTLTYVNVQDSNASTSNITCLDTTCVDAGNNDEDESTPFWIFTAATFFASATDDWNMGTAWGGACTTGCVAGTDFPGTSDTAVITDYSITVLSTVAASVTSLNINSGGKLITGGNDVTVSGDFTIDQGGTLIAQGGETISAIDTNNGTVMYNGTGSYNGLAAGDAYNDLTINNGLVGYWKFDDGTGTTVAKDSSGYGNDGTLTLMDSATDWVSGTPYLQQTNPYSLDFDGSNDYVNAGNNSSLDVGSGDFSLGLWFKTSTTSTNKELVGKGGGWTGGKRYHLVINDGFCGAATGEILAQIDDAVSEPGNCSATSGLNNNQWHQVYMVRDGGNLRLYIDGEEDANSPTDVSAVGDIDSVRPFAIGALYREDTAAYTWHFPGQLDDVRIYDHALTEQEINTLAAGSISPTGTGLQLLDANLDVNGDLVLNDGELDVSSSNYTINVAGSYENNGGAFNPRSSTVTLDGTSGSHELQIGGQAFNNLTVSGSGGTWTLNDDLDVDGTYTQSNGTVNTNSTDNWSVHANDFDQTAGTFTPNTSSVTVDSASNQTIQAASSLYDLQVEDPTETGLVGYWKFDEGQGTTAADSSGSGNTGTLTNSPKWSTTVTSTITYDNPYSLDFDGTDDYVDMDNPSSLRLTASATWSAWVKLDNQTTARVFMSKQSGAGSRGWQLYGYNPGSGWVFVTDIGTDSGNDTLERRGSTTPSLGVWYNVVSVYDSISQTFDIYLNGSIDNGTLTCTGTSCSSSVPSSQHNASVSVNIGRKPNNTQWFDGLIDDVRVYNAALSAPEVASLSDGYYANGDSGTATFTLNANLDVNNSLTLQSGILDVSATPYNITLAKDWNNYGGASSFTDQTGNVTLDGTSQTIRGTTTFYDLTDQETATDTLTFETGKTQTIANTLDFDGASSNLLSLRSSVPSTRYTLDVTSAQTLTYVNVQDSNASTSNITCLDTTCVDAGNNDEDETTPFWIFTEAAARGRVMIISLLTPFLPPL